ncbi:MAG: DUF4197 domain-containing protein [Ginsengibacter sp.]
MKQILSTFTALLITFSISAQTESSGALGGILNKSRSILNKKNDSSPGLSSAEIVSGLKEALSVGAQKSGDRLSTVDGFFKDAAVKILLPEQVRNVEKKMRLLGMGKLVDNAILSMNRGAEDASRAAAPIFLAAIKKMTVTDALSILKGSDTSATAYLRKSTTLELTDAFRPVIEASLKKVDATKYWTDVFEVYNKFSSTPVDTDINNYVTGRSLDGIFYYVAKEETGIRKNPAQRINDILKKVFGGN